MKNRRTGVSLIELMISVVLIAIVAVMALKFLIYCDAFAMKADAKIAAENFARETMEGLYQKQYADAALTTGSYDAGTTSSLALPAGTNFGSRLRNRYPTSNTNTMRIYTVGSEQTDTLTNTQYKVITVTVTWQQ